MILGLYLFLPWIHAALNQMKKRDIEVFLAILCLKLFANWPGLASYFLHIELMYFSGYLGYLVLGHSLCDALSHSGSDVVLSDRIWNDARRDLCVVGGEGFI
jgi:surface polysaccharide O-acyltransferase-like enzyme